MKKPMKLSNNRYGQALSSKDSGGVSRADVIQWSKTGKEVKFLQPQVDTSIKFNIIPFVVKSKNHPLVAQREMQIGELDFMLDLWVHRYVGATKADVVCPKKNYGKPCPICELVSQLYDQGKEDEAKQIKPSRRCYFNVQPITKMGPEALHVFSVSHYLFTKELIEEANACADGQGIIPFADLEDGSTIACRVVEEAFGKNKTTKYKSFRFLKREEEVGEDIVDKAISFDEFLVVKTPKELEDILYGADDSDTAQQDQDDSDGEEPPRAQSKPTKAPPTDEEIGDVFEEEDRKAQNKSASPEKESQASKVVPGGESCPYGGTFGKDTDDLRQCRRCSVWDACSAAKG